MRILNCIIRKTYGWNKKEDHISFSQFEKETGISRRNAIRAVKKLASINIISFQKNNVKGNLYRINKEYKTWKGSVEMDTCVEIDSCPNGATASVKTCKKVVSKRTHTKDTIQKTLTIDKDLTLNNKLLGLISVWFKYKQERGQMYKSASSAKVFVKELIKLSKGDDDVATAIITTSIANNWAGIFEPKNKGENHEESRIKQTINAGKEYLRGNYSE